MPRARSTSQALVRTASPRTPSSTPVRRPGSSLFASISRHVVLLMALTIAMLGSLSFVVVRAIVIRQTLLQISDTASLREDLLEEAVRQERERTSLLGRRIVLPEAPTEEQAAQIVQQVAEDLRGEHVAVLGVTLFGSDRRVLSSTGAVSSVVLQTPGSTLFVPFIDRKEGWLADDVYVTLGGERYLLAVRYDARAHRDALFSLQREATTMPRIAISRIQGGEASLVHASGDRPLQAVTLGSVSDPYIRLLPVTLAAAGVEGASLLQDERGVSVFAAYRYLPALGWGLTVEANAATTLAGVTAFGLSLAAIGLVLLGLSGVLGFFLARQLTLPLSELSQKVMSLRPGHWLFRRSIRTDDEVQMLDEVVADLAQRLKSTYDHLEEQVAERTEELRRQYVLDRTILQSIEYGVIVVDAKGIVTDVNPAACMLLQARSERLIGAAGNDALQVFERKKQRGSHPLDEVLKTRATFRSHPASHVSVLRADQTLLPVTFMAVPLLKEETLIGAIAVIQDMTEERQIDYMKSEFISLASHQLRTPLSSIRWYVEMLSSEKQSRFSKDEQAYLAEISTASKRMANLLEALLHVARLEGGALVPEMQSVDLGLVVRQISDEWIVTAKEKGFTLSVSLPQKKIPIVTDPILLQIIVQNLLNNAMKYSPASKDIQLAVNVDAHSVSITVSDHGVGIPMADQKRVFEKFYRAHNVRNLDTDGNGLGLYMSRAIAENLGGKIFFASEEGKGSTFTVELPRK